MKARFLNLMIAVALMAGLAVSASAFADSKHQGIPAIGSTAPAFGLIPYTKFKKGNDDRRPDPVQLDDHCGIHPAETKAVLVLFVDENHAEDLSLASNWSRKFQKDGLEILAVSLVKNPAVFSTQVMRLGLRFPVLDDRHKVVAARYGVQKAPFTFLLDSGCRVQGVKDKPPGEDSEALTNSIASLLGETNKQP